MAGSHYTVCIYKKQNKRYKIYFIQNLFKDRIFLIFGHSSIAVGYCHRHLKEYIQFIDIASASLGENYSQLFALTISGNIEEEWFAEYDKMHYSLENKLIKLNKENI